MQRKGESAGGGAEDVEDVAVLRETEVFLHLDGELFEDVAGDRTVLLETATN